VKTLRKLLHGFSKVENPKKVISRIKAESAEDLKEIQELNRKFSLLLASGSIEITIRNIDSILKEIKL